MNSTPSSENLIRALEKFIEQHHSFLNERNITLSFEQPVYFSQQKNIFSVGDIDGIALFTDEEINHCYYYSQLIVINLKSTTLLRKETCSYIGFLLFYIIEQRKDYDSALLEVKKMFDLCNIDFSKI